MPGLLSGAINVLVVFCCFFFSPLSLPLFSLRLVLGLRELLGDKQKPPHRCFSLSTLWAFAGFLLLLFFHDVFFSC